MHSMTRFSQLINQLPKRTFKRIVQNTQADRYTKTLKTWDMLVLMLYGHITQAKSLRTLVAGYSSHANSHYHLGSQAVKRSTVSEALCKRQVLPFKHMCEVLMTQLTRKQRAQSREMIAIIDSSPIGLKGKGFAWAKSTRTQYKRTACKRLKAACTAR